MPRVRATRLVAAGLAALVALSVVGCGATPDPSPSQASAAPSAPPVDFTLEVLPEVSVGRTIGGQPAVFLVTVGGAAVDEPVELVATAAGASISIAPQPLPPGVAGEITVVPATTVQDADLEVTIAARRGGTELRARRTLAVAPGEDTLRPEAERHLGEFLTWLAAVHPEFGIGPRTPWQGSPGSWVLAVEHYQFVSDEWELGLAWHVMIAPDDWATVYLRRRWTEARPSKAFRISSVSGGTEPREIAPPEAVWR
jgi:hypothetical protein